MSSESHSFSFDFFIKKLENADWSREFFERHHIEAYFNVSKRTAQRWISEALQAKYLIQKREGHKRFYKRTY